MKNMLRFRLLLLCAAGLAVSGLPAHLNAQSPASSAPPPAAAPPAATTAPAGPAVAPPAPAIGAGDFFESIDVSVVNVDVYVTDKKGNRVNGLTRDDFEILEDKKPMAITNFYAVDEGRPVPTAEELANPAPPGPAAVPGMPPEIPEDQRLHLVVYIDNFNIHPFSRNKTFTALREFCARADAGRSRDADDLRPRAARPAAVHLRSPGRRIGTLRAREAERLRHPDRPGPARPAA
jgi:hypothetical protein